MDDSAEIVEAINELGVVLGKWLGRDLTPGEVAQVDQILSETLPT